MVGVNISERYVISGTQLGMLIALSDKSERKKLVDEIIDKQFIGNSDKKIMVNVTDLSDVLSKQKLLTNPDLKLCTRCHCIKKRTNFYINKMSKDKLSSWCKNCTNEYYTKYHKENKG
jgi:hypothetical protein